MNLDFLGLERVESQGDFSFNPGQLRRRFIEQLLPDPAFYALKLVQAASGVGAATIDFEIHEGRGLSVRFSAAPEVCDWGLVEHALRDPSSVPEGPWRSIALGFWASPLTTLTLRCPERALRITFQEEQWLIEPAEEQACSSFEVQLEGPAPSKLGQERYLLESRCRLGYTQVRINGSTPSRDALPGILVQKISCSKLFEAESPSGSFGVNLPCSTDYTASGDGHVLVDGSDQPMFILGASELGRTVSLDSMYLLPDKLEGSNWLCFVQDGVVISKVESPFANIYCGEDFGSGAVAFLDATDIEKDPSGFRIAPSELSKQTQVANAEWKSLIQTAMDALDSGVIPAKKDRLGTIMSSEGTAPTIHSVLAIAFCICGPGSFLGSVVTLMGMVGHAKLESRVPIRCSVAWQERTVRKLARCLELMKEDLKI